MIFAVTTMILCVLLVLNLCSQAHPFLATNQITSSVSSRKISSQRDQGENTHKLKDTSFINRAHKIDFLSPLLDYGYPMAAEELASKQQKEKPILLYLPGFDGTYISPFIQFPEVSFFF